MYFDTLHKRQHTYAEIRFTQTEFTYSSVALWPIWINETDVIAELAVFTSSVLFNFHFSSFSVQLLNLT
jgi:hypothetical protein